MPPSSDQSVIDRGIARLSTGSLECVQCAYDTQTIYVRKCLLTSVCAKLPSKPLHGLDLYLCLRLQFSFPADCFRFQISLVFIQ